MILNIDDELFVDIDKISLIVASTIDNCIVVDGAVFTSMSKNHINAIIKAFKQNTRSYTYDKDLKAIKGEKK